MTAQKCASGPPGTRAGRKLRPPNTETVPKAAPSGLYWKEPTACPFSACVPVQVA